MLRDNEWKIICTSWLWNLIIPSFGNESTSSDAAWIMWDDARGSP